jgi:2',3'-cyclic-nucleotide 2'-phosphodiesterase (5'-nucleotidase family)
MRSLLRRAIALAALSVLPVMPAVRTLTILHTNDLHSRLLPLENHHGGFAYLASVIRRERANCTDCILLNAGDVAQGTPVSTIFHGLPVFEIANMLGFDASTLGNHDFDYGWEQARHFVDVARYPIVSSNLVGPKGELFTPKPYVILQVNGLKVGVIGAMTEDLKILTTPQTLGAYHTLPLVETVRKYAHELHSQCDIVVAVAHVTPQEELALLKSDTGGRGDRDGSPAHRAAPAAGAGRASAGTGARLRRRAGAAGVEGGYGKEARGELGVEAHPGGCQRPAGGRRRGAGEALGR